jgi:hypothetical protein
MHASDNQVCLHLHADEIVRAMAVLSRLVDVVELDDRRPCGWRRH